MIITERTLCCGSEPRLRLLRRMQVIHVPIVLLLIIRAASTSSKTFFRATVIAVGARVVKAFDLLADGLPGASELLD